MRRALVAAGAAASPAGGRVRVVGRDNGHVYDLLRSVTCSHGCCTCPGRRGSRAGTARGLGAGDPRPELRVVARRGDDRLPPVRGHNDTANPAPAVAVTRSPRSTGAPGGRRPVAMPRSPRSEHDRQGRGSDAQVPCADERAGAELDPSVGAVEQHSFDEGVDLREPRGRRPPGSATADVRAAIRGSGLWTRSSSHQSAGEVGCLARAPGLGEVDVEVVVGVDRTPGSSTT